MNLPSDTERTKWEEKEFLFRCSEILQEAKKGFYNTTVAEIAQAFWFADRNHSGGRSGQKDSENIESADHILCFARNDS